MDTQKAQQLRDSAVTEVTNETPIPSRNEKARVREECSLESVKEIEFSLTETFQFLVKTHRFLVVVR